MAFVSKRYLLFQIPGWILAILLLGAANRWLGLSTPLAVGLFLLFVAKDFFLYPYLRGAYEPDTRTGVELLIGCTGITRQPLDPEGYVLVKGELWRATAQPPGIPIAADTEVRIEAAEGLTLIVSAVKARNVT
jgi:membrane-bound serine protease (ClpP class)